MNAATKRARRHWSFAEKAKLRAVALPLLLEDPAMTIVQAVRIAQEKVLPFDRRRNLINMTAVPVDLRAQLEEESKDGTPSAGVVSRDELERAEARVAELVEQNRLLSDAVTNLRNHVLKLESRPTPPEPIEVVKDFLADILRRSGPGASHAVVSAITHNVVLPVHVADPAPKHDPLPKSVNGARKTKVILVGGHAQDHATLHAEFSNALDLRYFQGELEGPRIIQMAESARHAPHVLLWTDRVTHKMENALSKQRVEYRRVSGTLEAVKGVLRELAKVAA